MHLPQRAPRHKWRRGQGPGILAGMKTPLSLAACLALTCNSAGAADQASAEPKWLMDANGCKFLSVAPPNVSIVIEWTGQCVDGFVSGPGEVRLTPGTSFRGEFSQGRILKGVIETRDAVYEGGFLDNQPHGEGVFRLPDDSTTKLQFNRGIPADQAEIQWPPPIGARYRGQIDRRTYAPNGKGVMEYGDGAVYEGEFKQGRLDGTGVLKKPNGELRRGAFVNGAQEGSGFLQFSHGGTYEGEFRAGRASGRGKLIERDGTTYEGEFLADFFSGSGTMTFPDGARYVGQFLKGMRHGTGKFTRASGEIDDGEWSEGALSGECRLVRQERVYEGTCLGGMASGSGRLEDKTQNLVYEGEFLNDKFEGRGSLHLGELVYEGMFNAGAIEGTGELRVDKVTMRGEFKAGILMRGTISGDDGRTFEIDVEKDEVLEVLKDGTKRSIDELPPDITV